MKKRNAIALALAVIGVALLARKVVRSTQWRTAKNAGKYLPLLAAAELKYAIPTNLLARQAFQESRWRDDIVSGALKSKAGAVGIMQIIPRFHPNAQPLNVPAAIDYAAREMVRLKKKFGTWALALAAYNAGEGNVSKYGGIPPFDETQNYVLDILNDIV